MTGHSGEYGDGTGFHHEEAAPGNRAQHKDEEPFTSREPNGDVQPDSQAQ
jgi:hypothetical protein